MAMIARLLLVVAILVCEHEVLGQLFKMSGRDNGDALESLKPSVSEISKSIATAVKGGEDLELVITGIITKDLMQQMAKLRDVMRDSSKNRTDGICCVCRLCDTACQSCSASSCLCCCTGSGGCRCSSCATGSEVMTVESVGMSTSFKQWLESSKTMLKSDVARAVIGAIKTSDLCCSCSQCRQKNHGFGDDTCCVDGADCLCSQYSTKTVSLFVSSIWNPFSLPAGAEAVIGRLDNLVDKLAFYSSPL